MESLELLVVQELFMTETAGYAHVVLPAAPFLEKNGTFTNGERRIQRVNRLVEPLEGTKADGQIIVDIINRMGYPQEGYDPDITLQKISQVVPFFKGVRWKELGDNGKQWPVLEDGTNTKIMHKDTFKRGKGKLHFFDWQETLELIDHQEQFPYILTTGRILEQYNCGTMTHRTANQDLLSKDTLIINPADAADKKITDNDRVRLSSARGDVLLNARLSDEVKPGILYTTFHFPEAMVNQVTSEITGEESLCPEYKVAAVDFELVPQEAGDRRTGSLKKDPNASPA